jgi:hypothetical protein
MRDHIPRHHVDDGGFPACGVYISMSRQYLHDLVDDPAKVTCVNCKKGNLYKALSEKSEEGRNDK